MRRVQVGMYQEMLPLDLLKYEEAALGLGASRAMVVPVSDIPVDDRVTLKCRIPRCFGYGVGANCPPYTLTPAELRAQLEGFQWSVLVTVDVPPPIIIRDRETIVERVAAYQKVYEIVAAVESLAFYDGHYLAFGLAAGSCRHTFCGQQTDCSALLGAKMPVPLEVPAIHGSGGNRRLQDDRATGLGHLSCRQLRHR